ncbi:MAG: hypothetical protein F6J97_00145 [Leptolyngbya sp. SIO4C1]|nr:hypothetical protein [Leptolyngbya sp. SIO4C1]
MGVISQVVTSTISAAASCRSAADQSTSGSPVRWFKTLPPERIGLQGEYDYNGLAKRVYQQLHEALGAAAARRLKVRQRGRVILLSGYVASPERLAQIEQIALQLEGADAIETYAVMIDSWTAASA